MSGNTDSIHGTLKAFDSFKRSLRELHPEAYAEVRGMKMADAFSYLVPLYGLPFCELWTMPVLDIIDLLQKAMALYLMSYDHSTGFKLLDPPEKKKITPYPTVHGRFINQTVLELSRSSAGFSFVAADNGAMLFIKTGILADVNKKVRAMSFKQEQGNGL